MYFGLSLDCRRHVWKASISFQSSRIFLSSAGKSMWSGTAVAMASPCLYEPLYLSNAVQGLPQCSFSSGRGRCGTHVEESTQLRIPYVYCQQLPDIFRISVRAPAAYAEAIAVYFRIHSVRYLEQTAFLFKDVWRNAVDFWSRATLPLP